MFSTSNKQQLLNSTEYLNSVVSIGKKTQETFQNQINTNKNNIINKESTLQDLKDAISTYNQQFIELEGKNTEKSITLQDWSLFIFFAGYAAFSLIIFIHLLRFTTTGLLSIMIYMFLNILLYTFLVCIIQRFG
jgi:hypothetical protein